MLPDLRLLLVELRGFEPLTSSMPWISRVARGSPATLQLSPLTSSRVQTGVGSLPPGLPPERWLIRRQRGRGCCAMRTTAVTSITAPTEARTTRTCLTLNVLPIPTKNSTVASSTVIRT